MFASTRHLVLTCALGAALSGLAPMAFADKPPAAGSGSAQGGGPDQSMAASRQHADQLMAAGDYDGAIAELTDQITRNPKAWHSYYARGQAILRKMQHEQAGSGQGKGKDKPHGNPHLAKAAIDDFNQAIALEPGSAEAYYERGHAYFEQGQESQAHADYDKAVQLDSSIASRGWYGG